MAISFFIRVPTLEKVRKFHFGHGKTGKVSDFAKILKSLGNLSAR